MSLRELLLGFSSATRAKHPECFAPTTIDRHTCTRVVPMRVLCLGLSRTGTASMQAALTILGFPTYHGFHTFGNVADTDMWREAWNSKYFRDDHPEAPALDRKFFDKLLGHVSATTDLPTAAFGPELMAAYPDARVVLVERDIEGWYRSFHTVFVDTYASRFIQFVAWADPGYIGKLWDCFLTCVANGEFEAKDAEELAANARPVYRKHYAELRKSLKNQPERLLEFRLQEGWEPLCRFLGKEVPSVPFPRINESKIMEEKIRVLVFSGVRRASAKTLGVVLPTAVMGAALWWAWGSYF